MEQIRLCPGCMRELGKGGVQASEQKAYGQKMSAPGRRSQQGQREDGARCPYCGFCPSEYQQNPRCLPSDTILAGKYLVGKVLGEGGFGITYMGYDLNMKTRVAIKEYFPVELVTRDTTRRSAGDGGAVSGGSVSGSSAPGAFVSGGSDASAGDASSSGVSSSGGGSDRVISLNGEKSKTYQQGLKKYVDEARNVSQFAGIPGIVSVKDFFYENNTAYIVMEYIEGISLKEYLKQKGGKLSEEESFAILRPVLEALEKVHAAGIVHRDISPDNIMLTFAEEGKAGTGQSGVAAVYGNISAVKLIDFGAARMTSKNDQKSLTIILKHGYAPEEQYRSHGEQGPWTDVYALCAVLYRMLTGKVPESAMDRLFSDGLKRPEELGAKVSPAVSEAIMRGLAVKKEKRIQSVRELMDALYTGKKLKKRGSGKLSRPALIAAAAAGTLILAVAAVGIGTAIRSGNGMRTEEAGTDQGGVSGAVQDGQLQNAGQGGADGQTQNPDGGNASPDNASGTDRTGEENTVLLEEEEEAEIAFYSPQNAIAGNIQSPILMCLPDGSVKAFGDNVTGQCRVDGWGDVVAVSGNVTQSLGLDANGTVYAAGDNSMGECDVETWSDIVAVAAGFYASFGLKADGTVVGCGDVERYSEALESWKDIRAIAAYPGNNYGLVGLDWNGNTFYAGFEQELPQVTGWEDVEQISMNQRGEQLMLAGIRKDGSVVSYRLTVDEESHEYDELETWTEMKQFSMNTPALGVRSDGTVVCSSDAGEAVQAELASWSGMEAVTAIDQSGGVYVVGITQDGEIREYRENMGNTPLEEMKDLKWVHVLPDEAGSIAAETADGRILTYGQDWILPMLETGLREMGAEPGLLSGMEGRRTFYSEDGNVYGIGYGDRSSWKETGVKQVEELWDYAVYQGRAIGVYALLSEDGKVRIHVVDDGTAGSGLDQEERLEKIKEAESWTDIIQLGWDGYNLYGLHGDGSVSCTSDAAVSENGQPVKKLEGKQDVLAGLTEDARIIFLHSNEEAEEMGLEAAGLWENVADFVLGDSHIVGLLSDGTVTAAGSNHAGQCDVEDWENIVFLTAGRNCTLGITADGDLKIAGSLY